MEDRRRHCAGRGCELRVLGAERRARAQQANIRQRILQERVAALEALRQFLLLCDRRSHAIDRPGIEALRLRVGTKPGDRVLDRLYGLDEGVVVAKQAGARLQDVAMERGLGEREIVKGLERHRIGWCVRVNSAQQQPSEQREQQENPERTRQEPHGIAVAARGVAVAGRTI